jgi:hypothetical protein
MYTVQTMQRLPLSGPDGDGVGNPDRIILGTITVR